MITVRDGLCLHVHWCRPSSYAYADCDCDWALYVEYAVNEEQGSLIKGIYDVIRSPQGTVVARQLPETYRHVCLYTVWTHTLCSRKHTVWYTHKPIDQRLKIDIPSSKSMSDKRNMTDEWASLLCLSNTFPELYSLCFQMLYWRENLEIKKTFPFHF